MQIYGGTLAEPITDVTASISNLVGRAVACTLLVLSSLVLVTAAAPPDAGAQTAMASGVACNPTGGAGGFAPGSHNTTIAGRPTFVHVGEGYDPANPTMLAYYLHGDGGNDQDFLSESLRDLFDANGWIYVAPLANDTGPGALRWWSTGAGSTPADIAGIEANAVVMSNVLEQMFGSYNVCRDVLLGSSASGGSWFYDGYFLPTRGNTYPTYMNVGCGSSGINNSWAAFPFYANLLTFNTNAAIQARTKMHYTIGTADFLFASSQDAIPHYQSLGFEVTTDILAGVEHCAFDVGGATATYFEMLCTSGFVPAQSFDAGGGPRAGSCNPATVAPAQTCNGLAVTVDIGLGESPTPGNDVILGTAGNDVIAAQDGDDVICGLGGNDTIWGQNGNDQIFGGDGDDKLRGGAGNDDLAGEAGVDDLNGGTGDDEVRGGAGDDKFVRGGTGDDQVFGGDGNDPIVAGNGGQDIVDGEAGDDKVTGGPRPDIVSGGTGNDEVKGHKGADQLFGGDGNDMLLGGPQPDALDGGTGTDDCNGGTTGSGAPEGDTAINCATLTSIP